MNRDSWLMRPTQALEEDLAKLLVTVRRLPPGTERHEALKQIGRLRLKIDAIISEQQQKQSEK
jgi:hypothetical protein